MNKILYKLDNKFPLTQLTIEEISENKSELLEYIYKQEKDNSHLSKIDILFVFNQIVGNHLKIEEIENIFVKQIISRWEITYNDLTEKLKENPIYFKAAGLNKPEEVLFMKNLFKDKNWIIECLKKHPSFYKYIDQSLKDNENFIIDCLKNTGILIKYIEENKRNNINLCHTALNSYFNFIDLEVWKEIPLKFQKDINFVSYYIKKVPALYNSLLPEIKRNPLIYNTAIDLNVSLISYLDEDLKNNSDVIIKFITDKNFSLNLIGEKLLEDSMFLSEALKYHPNDIFLCAKKIKNNKNIAKIVLSQQHKVIKNYSFKNQKNLNPYISFFNENIKNDNNLALLSLKQNVNSIDFLPEKYKRDKDFILNYMKSKNFHSDVINKLDNSLLKDKDIIFTYAKKDKLKNLKQLDPIFKTNDEYFNDLIEILPGNYQLIKLFDFKKGDEKKLYKYLNQKDFIEQNNNSPSVFKITLKKFLTDDYYKKIVQDKDIYVFLNSFVLKENLENTLSNKSISVKRNKI